MLRKSKLIKKTNEECTYIVIISLIMKDSKAHHRNFTSEYLIMLSLNLMPYRYAYYVIVSSAIQLVAECIQYVFV